MTGFTGIIYTDFNVTPCDKKCNFFIFLTHREMQQQHDLLSEYLGLNVYFYALFFVCILGLNVCFYTFLIGTEIVVRFGKCTKPNLLYRNYTENRRLEL